MFVALLIRRRSALATAIDPVHPPPAAAVAATHQAPAVAATTITTVVLEATAPAATRATAVALLLVTTTNHAIEATAVLLLADRLAATTHQAHPEAATRMHMGDRLLDRRRTRTRTLMDMEPMADRT
jgi:hypothetical protein